MSRSNLSKLKKQLGKLEGQKIKTLRRIEILKRNGGQLLQTISFVEKQITQMESDLALKHNAESTTMGVA